MKKKIYLLAAFILAVIILTGCMLQTKAVDGYGNEVKYTMYVGLNDKDTYTQLISTEDAEKKVSEIALRYVDGFTQLSAKGAYKDEDGIVTYENSLVFEFYSATEEQMKSIMNDIIRELNQNSVLIEKENVSYRFYEGE